MAKGNWDAVPIGQRLTLTEAAAVIGIDRESLRRNYAWSGQNVQNTNALPEGFQFIRENGRALFLIRTK